MEPHVRESRRRLLVAFAGINALMYWIGLVGSSVRGGTLGVDLGVFHAAGSLIRSDGYEAAYDPESFGPYFETNYFPALADGTHVSHFISPPPFGLVAQALSAVPFDALLVLWLVASVVAIMGAVRLLGLPLWAGPAVLALPPMATNTALGQTGAFVLLLTVAMWLAARNDRTLLLGLLGGLLVIKPTLAIGFAIWWLFDLRRYRIAIVGALVSSAVLVIPSLIGGVGPWRGFVDATENRAELEGQWKQFSPSLPEFLKLAFPGSPAPVTVGFWLAGLVLAIGVVAIAYRRWQGDAELMFATAIVATVLASPHLLTYDTMVLVVPVAIAWRRGWLDDLRLLVLVALHVGSIALAGLVYEPQFSLTQSMFGSGRGIGIEFVALVAASVLLWRWSSSPPPGRSSTSAAALEGAVA